MDRKWKSGAAGAPPALDNASDGYATAGNPGTGVPATKPGAHMWHMVVEELLAVINAGGLTPDKAVVTQVRDALKKYGILGGSATALLDLSGATGGQIKFPGTQNASANANTLDDYKEVAWTPVLGGAGGTSGQAYTEQDGFSIKAGRLFVGIFKVTQSTRGTITGNLQVQGLPYAMSYAVMPVAYYVINTAVVWLSGILSGTTAMEMRMNTAAAVNTATMAQADLSATNAQLWGVVLGVTQN